MKEITPIGRPVEFVANETAGTLSTTEGPGVFSDTNCRICASSVRSGHYEVPEMMFGLRERFPYFQCGDCGCLQITHIPADIGRFYPPDYYAHQPRQSSHSATANFFRNVRNRYAFTGKGLVGKLLFDYFGYYGGEVFKWLVPSQVSLDSRILDVGSGFGLLLGDFRSLGYRHLLGVDPFIEASVEYPDGVRIIKGSMDDLSGPFDLIMLHHSLEHIPDQIATFNSLARLLTPGGRCVIRIPVASSFAWEHFRENWVQIDAPRHFYLHTVNSMRILGDLTGLELVEVISDSTEFQFTGSEMYRRNLPLTLSPKGLFTRAQLRAFRRQARLLNDEGRGDSASFFYRRSH